MRSSDWSSDVCSSDLRGDDHAVVYPGEFQRSPHLLIALNSPKQIRFAFQQQLVFITQMVKGFLLLSGIGLTRDDPVNNCVTEPVVVRYPVCERWAETIPFSQFQHHFTENVPVVHDQFTG